MCSSDLDAITKIDGGDKKWIDQFHFGDWLALDHPSRRVDEVEGGTEKAFIAHSYYAYSAQLVAKAASVLDNAADASAYQDLADRLVKGLRTEYFTGTGRFALSTLTAYVLALYFELTENKERTTQELLQKMKDSSFRLETGFVGTPLLCNVLSDAGLGDIAYKLLLNEDYPGWLYEVKLGATTIWERWNSIGADGKISSTGMNSLNHYAYGSIVEWMYRHVAGINPVEEAPGFRAVRLTPMPHAKLKEVDCTYQSPAGTYHIGWKVLGVQTLQLQVTIPFGCSATLVLPYATEEVFASKDNALFEQVLDGVCHLGAGTYEITYETSQPLKKVYSTMTSIAELLSCPATRKVLERVMPTIGSVPTAARGMRSKSVV